MENKTIMQVLAEMEETTLVYMGSQSAFFDIEMAGLLREKGYMSALSESLEKQAQEQADCAKREFDRALRNPPKWTGKEKTLRNT